MKADTLRTLLDLLSDDDCEVPESFPFEGAVIVRTVTHYYCGRVESVQAGFLVLSDAAWVASTGRWADALATGSLDEVEPYPDQVAVSLGAIVDVAPWGHTLPRNQK